MYLEPSEEPSLSDRRRLTSFDDRPLDVRWGLRDVIYGALSTIGIFVVLLGAVVIAYAAGIALGIAALSEEGIVKSVFALEAVLLLPAWFWGPRRYQTGLSTLGLRGFDPLKGVLAVVIGFGLTLALDVAWTPVVDNLELSEQPNVLPMFGEGVSGLLVALLVGAVVAPIAEEVLFRGFFYAGLRNAWGRGWAIVVSAVVFAVVHGFSGVIPPIFLMGVILALAYEYTGSIWPSILLHSAVNSFSFLVAFFAQ